MSTSTDHPSTEQERLVLPVLPLRDVVVFPHMVIPLFVGRDKSIRALDIAMEGDKRILLIDGEPVPFALARIPQGDEFRGNLAAGGRGEGQPLSTRDRDIAAEVGPWLKQQGMLFVGLDVIGDCLTEINVTSPTCIRELDAQFKLNIAGQLFDAVEQRLERQ